MRIMLDPVLHELNDHGVEQIARAMNIADNIDRTYTEL
jgi:hypothetical protein